MIYTHLVISAHGNKEVILQGEFDTVSEAYVWAFGRVIYEGNTPITMTRARNKHGGITTVYSSAYGDVARLYHNET